MIYTIPHYYKQFRCIASGCPDTCCAGWAIMIDRKSLENYRHMEMRMLMSIDLSWSMDSASSLVSISFV